MVELVRAGRTPEELEKEFEPTAQTIYNWVAQAGRDAGVRHDGMTTAEGGFNRSSQHLKLRRCCDGSKCKAGVSVDRASSDVLTGCTVA
jgi:transposase